MICIGYRLQCKLANVTKAYKYRKCLIIMMGTTYRCGVIPGLTTSLYSRSGDIFNHFVSFVVSLFLGSQTPISALLFSL